MIPDTPTVAECQDLAAALLCAVGVPEDAARRTATCIVIGDAWGIASHGLMRLPYYLDRLTSGGHPPQATLSTLADTGPLVSMTGDGGLGHWQLWEAAKLAATRAATFGVAVVSVADSGHCGALGVYTAPGIEAGMVSLVFSNGPAVMPAYGGATPVFSTSPLAAGLPTRPHHTIVDMASSTVARGKIAAHAAENRELPPGWALDAQGRPTVDPHTALHGMLAPLGGAKGSALALIVEALAGAVVGPHLSTEVSDMFREDQRNEPQRIGHLVITLDPTRFSCEPDDARTRLDRLAQQLTATGARLPGSRRPLPDRIDSHITINPGSSTRDQLERWCTRLQLENRSAR